MVGDEVPHLIEQVEGFESRRPDQSLANG